MLLSSAIVLLLAISVAAQNSGLKCDKTTSSPSSSSPLALSDIALVLVSSRSEAAAEWVAGQRFWRKKGVDIIVLASNDTADNEWPVNAHKGGREAWIRAKGGDDAEVAATAAVEAMAFLRAHGGTTPKWLFVTQAHSVVNLLALRDALAELDPSEPHAVTDALFCERRGGGAAAQQRRLRNSPPHANGGAGAVGACAPCHHGNSMSPAECAKINPAGGVALSWALLASCRPFADTAAAEDLLYAALAIGGADASSAAHAAAAAHSGGVWGGSGGGGSGDGAGHPAAAPHSVGAGLLTLSRVLWVFGVPVAPAWGEEPRVAISATTAAAAAAAGNSGSGNTNDNWVVQGGRFKRVHALAGQPTTAGASNVTDVATLAAAVAGGSCSTAGCLNALYRTVVPTAATAALGAGPAVAATVVTSALSGPAAGTAAGAQQLAKLYEALAAAWEKAAVARKTAVVSKDSGAKEGKKPARSSDAGAKAASAASAEAPTQCPQPGPLQPGERWEDGVLLVQVDTRAPGEPKPDPFALGPNYVMPPYPPWPDFDAGIKYGPVFLGESPQVGFYPAPGQYTYTADPKQHTYYSGTATMNRLVAEGLGMAFHRITWPVKDPNERYGTWTKNDFFMKVMQYVLYEQCGLAAPAGGSKASRLEAAHVDIIRQILPPGGLRLLIFLDGDVYIRDPLLFHKQLAAFHDDPSAWLAFSEEPNQRNAYAVVSPQYVNTGLQVLRPSPELLRYYEAVWDSPYTLNRTDLLWGWPHEQGCHNLLTYQGKQLLRDHIQRWPFMDYNTPGGRVARHAWGIRDQWWPILAEDMVAVSVWNFHQRHSASVYVPAPAWS